MNLLDVFRKSKKDETVTASLGKMWVCAVKFDPCATKWYDVIIKETDIMSVWSSNGITYAESSESNPFNKCSSIILRGQAGCLKYISQLCQWIGFFETKKGAEDEYRLFVANLMRHIESASAKIGFSGETWWMTGTTKE